MLTGSPEQQLLAADHLWTPVELFVQENENYMSQISLLDTYWWFPITSPLSSSLFFFSELFPLSATLSFLFLHLTYESSVGLQAHGSALSHTARGRQRRGLAVVLEISEPRSETHTHTNTTHRNTEENSFSCVSAEKQSVHFKVFWQFHFGFSGSS